MVEETIPDLKLDAKNRIIEQTKKIPLLISGAEGFVVIRKLNTGTRNKIRSECTNVKILGGQPQVKVDESEIQEKILAKAIIETSFEFDVTVESIKKLPCEVTDYLFNEYSKFAEPTLKKNLDSSKD